LVFPESSFKPFAILVSIHPFQSKRRPFQMRSLAAMCLAVVAQEAARRLLFPCQLLFDWLSQKQCVSLARLVH
jgi:hypothetical protein